jgi:hypothetical protein
MSGTHRRWWIASVLVVGLLLPGSTHAGPYLGDFGWCWKPAPDCPCSEYCFLHYWTPALYRAIYHFHPAHLDQYPPALPVAASFELEPSCCRTIPPMPTHPYADPAGFFGRPVLPDESAQKDNDKEKDKVDKGQDNKQ